MSKWCGETGLYEVIVRCEFPYSGSVMLSDGVYSAIYTRDLYNNLYYIEAEGESREIKVMLEFDEFDELSYFEVIKNTLNEEELFEFKEALNYRFDIEIEEILFKS